MRTPVSRISFAAFAFIAATAFGQPMTLAVDATDTPRGLLHARMSIPIAAGAQTLVYPKWLPGEHGPTGPLLGLVNVQIRANGQRVDWQRDPVEMYAMHLDVPAGTKSLDVTLDFLLPSGGNFSAGRTATTELAVISWNTVALYPAGSSADDISVAASLRIPGGWRYATALPVSRIANDTIEFSPASLATVIDSPVQIARHQKIVKLHTADGRPHDLNIAADSDAAIDLPADFAVTYDNLVDQAGLIFGGRHYRGYHWLLTLSDGVAHFGLEHHESSDDRIAEDSLQTPAGQRGAAYLLSHEYVHSWNGKYRRPEGLLSASYQTPMRGELLWVYEGLTEYLSYVLPARIGAWTPEQMRDHLAATASRLESESGRAWRPLADTAVEAQVLYNSPGDWWSLRRGTDFYEESVYVWLEADTIIRQESGGKRSLDDFLRRFYGTLTAPMVKPYSYDDVIAAMNETQRYDWRAFFDTRLRSVAPHAPLGGIERAGWKLVYNDTPNESVHDFDVFDKHYPFTETIGLELKENGVVSDVTPGRAAANAGLSPGFTIIAVNGRKFSNDVLKNAVRASKTAEGPIEIIAQNGDTFAVHRIDYHGGVMYPHLERDPSKPDLLSAIGEPLKRPPRS